MRKGVYMLKSSCADTIGARLKCRQFVSRRIEWEPCRLYSIVPRQGGAEVGKVKSTGGRLIRVLIEPGL